MMHRSLVLLILMLAGSMLSFAAQPLPNPVSIFDSSVEVLAVHPVADNMSRVLALFRDGAWVSLPYPDALTEVSPPRGIERPDGTVAFLEPGEVGGSPRIWIADFGTGAVEQIASPCGPAEIGFGTHWVYMPVGEDTTLCNWVTGQTSPVLPDRLAWGLTQFDAGPPDLSPNGRFLAVRGYISDDNIYGDRFYSYEIETRAFRLMGDVLGHHDLIKLAGWLSPTLFVISASDMPEWSTRFRYVGDVTEAGSLHHAISGWRFAPLPVLDPPGLQVMHADLEDGPTAGPCVLEFYDAATRRISSYDTGSLCEYGVPIPDATGDQLFRAIYPGAAVVRYNIFTGARRNLYLGEVESLGPVAPDGSRALVALGDSARVDTEQDVDLNFGIELPVTEYHVIDLGSGYIHQGIVTSGVTWLESRFLYREDTLYSLDDMGIAQTALPGTVVLTVDDPAARLLLRTSGGLALYDPRDETSTPVASLPAGYDVNVSRLGGADVRIALEAPAGDRPPLTFEVRLP